MFKRLFKQKKFNSMNLYPKLIKDALATVIYPGTKKNLVDSNMVADNIRINELTVSFSLIFPRETDPFLKSTVKAAEAAIHYSISPDVQVTITTQFLSKKAPEPGKFLPDVKNVIAVSSGKGGVGKSTVAVNLAIALSKLGYKVGILDCDIFGPSIPKMLGIEDARPYGIKKDGRDLIEPIDKYGIKILSIGFFVNPDAATLWRGMMASNALTQLIRDSDWGDLDYLIIDTPPGTGDVHITLLQEFQIGGALVVTTPQLLSMSDVQKVIKMFNNEQIGIPVLGIIENMSWFSPSAHPDEKYFLFGENGGASLASQFNIPLLAQIPVNEKICSICDQGQINELFTDQNVFSAYQSIVKSIIE